MIRTDNGSLEKTPNIFESISVSKAAHVFAMSMVNRNMDRVVVANSDITRMPVSRDNFGFVRELCFKECAKRRLVNAVLTAVLKPYFAAAFNRTKDYALVDGPLFASLALGCVHPLYLAADERF